MGSRLSPGALRAERIISAIRSSSGRSPSIRALTRALGLPTIWMGSAGRNKGINHDVVSPIESDGAEGDGEDVFNRVEDSSGKDIVRGLIGPKGGPESGNELPGVPQSFDGHRTWPRGEGWLEPGFLQRPGKSGGDE